MKFNYLCETNLNLVFRRNLIAATILGIKDCILWRFRELKCKLKAQWGRLGPCARENTKNAERIFLGARGVQASIEPSTDLVNWIQHQLSQLNPAPIKSIESSTNWVNWIQHQLMHISVTNKYTSKSNNHKYLLLPDELCLRCTCMSLSVLLASYWELYTYVYDIRICLFGRKGSNTFSL